MADEKKMTKQEAHAIVDGLDTRTSEDEKRLWRALVDDSGLDTDESDAQPAEQPIDRHRRQLDDLASDASSRIQEAAEQAVRQIQEAARRATQSTAQPAAQTQQTAAQAPAQQQSAEGQQPTQQEQSAK